MLWLEGITENQFTFILFMKVHIYIVGIWDGDNLLQASNISTMIEIQCPGV